MVVRVTESNAFLLVIVRLLDVGFKTREAGA